MSPGARVDATPPDPVPTFAEIQREESVGSEKGERAERAAPSKITPRC